MIFIASADIFCPRTEWSQKCITDGLRHTCPYIINKAVVVGGFRRHLMMMLQNKSALNFYQGRM